MTSLSQRGLSKFATLPVFFLLANNLSYNLKISVTGRPSTSDLWQPVISVSSSLLDLARDAFNFPHGAELDHRFNNRWTIIVSKLCSVQNMVAKEPLSSLRQRRCLLATLHSSHDSCFQLLDSPRATRAPYVRHLTLHVEQGDKWVSRVLPRLTPLTAVI